MTGFYNRDLTLYSPVVTICTTSLTFNNSTFCPHSVFMCFMWISEQTAIISLYNINWLVFITETECVYCAVRTGYFKCNTSTYIDVDINRYTSTANIRAIQVWREVLMFVLKVLLRLPQGAGRLHALKDFATSVLMPRRQDGNAYSFSIGSSDTATCLCADTEVNFDTLQTDLPRRVETVPCIQEAKDRPQRQFVPWVRFYPDWGFSVLFPRL